MEWTSIEERMPEPGTKALVAILYNYTDTDTSRHFYLKYVSTYCCIKHFILPTEATNTMFPHKVTHWMKLPDSPKI